VTITLTPETEARLRERAEREQQDLSVLADALLAEALAEDPDDLTSDEVRDIRAGIRRGLDDCAAGRVQPAAQWAARLRQELRLPAHTTGESTG
jgi:predicted transcriptional regulator